ncbi:response regulator [Chitinophagaceae bacterium LB-8]|uniref:Response regulator n=1 Tax=Paraflavisolibacter caeni TaxID=2982496 RepID=A0A9X2XT21_9BACT|nr:response regulator [Paraflavisolibacter caeni]MCU7547756.1 response regulator [Paraflavisolibacter caeni]
MQKLARIPVLNQSVPVAKILLVDDDADDLLFLSSSFSKASPEVRLKQAYSVREAMIYLNRLSDEQLPSLIVIDYNMPLQDGLDFLKILHEQERFRDIKKIVLSTAQSALINKVCVEQGADACFTKPLKLEQYRALAERALEEFINN